jgi:hypothetical protein
VRYNHDFDIDARQQSYGSRESEDAQLQMLHYSKFPSSK